MGKGCLNFQLKYKNWQKVDLGENLGNLLKPSEPDFGYEDEIYFKENKRSTNNWGLFLDFVQRYPKRERISSLVKDILNAK